MATADPIELLIKHVKTTNRLLAAQLRAEMSQQDMVKLLSGTELTAKEIAEVLDTTPATVAVTVQRLKKKKSHGHRGAEKSV